ncbi:MAG TPA: glycosyltransferase family 9 protein [Candidatus Elarobacter sp.]|jgi:ADP-heptose:LPS heptosyltransferase|nr:glycosyltransferase family 9 protein [Candidatus Elarobacter sp.]
MMRATSMRIVVLRALKLGDFLTGVPAYRALRRAHPDAEIVLAAPRALEPLRELLGAAIDRISDARPLEALAEDAHGAEVGVNLHGSGPQSHRVLLGARARSLLAFRNEHVPESADGPEHDPNEHEVARWCRLLRHYGIAADARELDLDVPPVLVPRRIRGATLIHPGAASEARRWPAERWIEVARAEQRLGRAVIVTGGPDEVDLAHRVADAAGIPSTHVYAGRTNLRELAALVAAAGRVVCGDTGVAHLATAYRRPSVVLFGPVPPTAWGPPQRPYHRVIWNGTTGDPHANRVDPGLLAIPPERVIAALDGLGA